MATSSGQQLDLTGLTEPLSGAERDAKPADAKASNAKSSDTNTSDAKASDAKASDAKASDAKASDAKTSDAKTSDAKASDAKTSDAKPSEAEAPPVEAQPASSKPVRTKSVRTNAVVTDALPATAPRPAPELGDPDEVEEPTAETPSIANRIAATEPTRSIAERLMTLTPRQDAIAGATLGAAIGDAMGHPTEFLSLEAIKKKWGPNGVTAFELYWDRDGKHFAPYTDDTQMAEAVFRSLLHGRRDDLDLDATMQDMAKRFIAWSRNPQGGHRAPGNACMSGCRALEGGAHWSKAGGATAGGCGSVMRAFPFGLLFHDDLLRAERWSVEHSKLTHRDPIALAASAAMAVGMALVLRNAPVRTVTSEMVAAACRYSATTAAMMAAAIDDARTGVAPTVTLDRLRAWAAHEAIASAVYIFERHPDDARAAILEGANTPGDSDSIATLAGALVGARVGARGLPMQWVTEVERADELLELALQV